ncbi:MAG: hypothetical protein LKM31_07405 [Sphingobium sp.]|jgi:hypothetical protein|nr:hypothetical protein [Sphingobium sp.]
MKRLMMAFLLAGVATPAFATDTSFAPSGATASVQFKGTRAVQCEVKNYDAQIDFGALGINGAGSTVNDSGIDFFCNTIYDASVESTNGYLKLVSTNPNAQPVSQTNLAANGFSGFAAAIDYQVAGIFGTANSAAISASVPVNLGTNLPPANITGASISYSTVTGSLPLLAGTYKDTLTLTITPQAL